MLRPVLVLAAALALAGSVRADVVPPSEAEMKWAAEIADANEAYATRPTAILKIDDAIYLRPGQEAWLEIGPDGEYLWTLTKPASGIKGHVAAGADLKTALFDVDGEDAADLAAEGAGPHPLSDTVRLTAGVAQIEPGKEGMRVAVYNDANKDAAAFTGLSYYDYDPAFVVEAKFEPAAKLEPKVFQTSRGWYKQFYYAGDAVFTLKGVAVRLPMYAGSDKPDEIDSLAAFIMDDTTGKETYGVGRYVDVEIAKGALPKAITIDFNFLYNPNCARSEHYNCPVAVDRVKLPITVGEKKPEGHS